MKDEIIKNTHLEDDIVKELIKKETEKRADILRRRRIKVKDTVDLKEKYELYGIKINNDTMTVTLKEPIDVNYFQTFKRDCYKLRYYNIRLGI